MVGLKRTDPVAGKQLSQPIAASRTVSTAWSSQTNLTRVDPDLLPIVLGDRPDEADLLPARQRRLDWAALLRRVFLVDVLRCPKCDGPT